MVRMIQIICGINVGEGGPMVPTHVDVDEEDRNVDVDDYRDIDFTLVIQMFYPFSLQTHPDSFPGKTKLKYLQESWLQNM